MDSAIFDPDYDDDQGIVQRRVFADPGIYRAEIETVFGRSWLFVAPAAWLAQAGDFVTSRMGREPVIAWRDDTGALRIFFNRCTRSDEPLTLAARGCADHFRCPCHGLTYTAAGAAGSNLEWVERVAIWRGLVFANFDAEAPPLEDWIGDFAWYLELFLPAAGPGEIHDDAMRWIVEANWKLPVLAGCGDLFDDPATHDGTIADKGVQVSIGGGVIAMGDRQTHSHDDPRDGFVPLVAALFPNLWFDRGTHSLNVVHPIGPTRCEIHSYCLVDATATLDNKEAARRLFQFQCGPAGIQSGHKAQLWQAVTAGARSANRPSQPLSLRLGLGRSKPSNLPGLVAPLVSEANQRSFFRWRQKLLSQPARAVRHMMKLRRGS